MDVVQKLLKEKSELYDIIKKNYIVPEVHTGYCQDCHETQDQIDNYKHETLEIPQQSDCECMNDNVQQDSMEEQHPSQIQQNVPLFL